MIVANFLTLEKKHYNIRITFREYIHYLLNRKEFIIDLGIKFGVDLHGSFYFRGITWKGM